MVQIIQVTNKNKSKLGSSFCVPSWVLKDNYDYLLIPSNSDAYMVLSFSFGLCKKQCFTFISQIYLEDWGTVVFLMPPYSYIGLYND